MSILFGDFIDRTEYSHQPLVQRSQPIHDVPQLTFLHDKNCLLTIPNVTKDDKSDDYFYIIQSN